MLRVVRLVAIALCFHYHWIRMHERFIGSLTTAGVGDGPTETCLQLYWSNISGLQGLRYKKKLVFTQKWS